MIMTLLFLAAVSLGLWRYGHINPPYDINDVGIMLLYGFVWTIFTIEKIGRDNK